MIKFRNGVYCCYLGEEFELSFNTDEKLVLYCRERTTYISGFACIDLNTNTWKKIIENNQEITNAFSVVTKCLYNGYTFQVENYNENSIRITTGDVKAFEELKLHFVDREWYDLVVSLDQVDKIWEERYPSGFRNLPFPKEIEPYKELRK